MSFSLAQSCMMGTSARGFFRESSQTCRATTADSASGSYGESEVDSRADYRDSATGFDALC